MTVSYLIIAALLALLLAAFFAAIGPSVPSRTVSAILALFVLASAAIFITCAVVLVLHWTGVLTL